MAKFRCVITTLEDSNVIEKYLIQNIKKHLLRFTWSKIIIHIIAAVNIFHYDRQYRVLFIILIAFYIMFYLYVNKEKKRFHITYYCLFYLVCALACSLLAIQSRLDTYIFTEKMRRKISEICP